MSYDNRKARKAKTSEEGIALLTTLFALGIITLLGLALTATGMIEVKISGNERQSTNVLYVADAGLVHAQGIIFSENPDFTTLLQTGDGTACNGDELSTGFTDPITAIGAGGHAFGADDRYEVRVCDDPDETDADPDVDTNARILVRSIGFGRDGATATVEMVIGVIPFPGIVTGGPLRIDGSPVINGPGGGIHTNSDLDVNGNPQMEQFANASGSISVGGSISTGPPPVYGDSPADTSDSEPPLDLPDINPADFIGMADFVITFSGGSCFTNGIPGLPFDWSCDPGGNRIVAGNDIPPGTYHTTGNVNISGNPGEGVGGISLTILADGYVEISGNPEMNPALTTGGISYGVVAGTDLKVNGSPSNPYTGVYYCRHQLDFSGNPEITGMVIALDDDDFGTPTNIVVREGDGFMKISGNPTITTVATGVFTTKVVAGWREVRQ